MDILGWLITNWFVIIVIAAIILFGFIGYMVDRKKYDQYRQEILNEEYAASTMQAIPGINEVADVIPANNNDYGYDPGYANTYDNGTGMSDPGYVDPGYNDQGPVI